MNMQAIILAGGFGTRLRDVVNNVPKPMANIYCKPFLAWIIENMGKQGVNEVCLSVYYLADCIKDYFGDDYQGIKIKYAYEDEPLGTGGALANAMNILKPTKPVIGINGDTVVNISYQDLYKKHSGELTTVLKKMNDCSRYGCVSVGNDGFIKSFKDKGQDGVGLINAGTYVLSPDLFNDMPEKFSFEADFMRIGKAPALAYITDEYFIDIGVPEDYKKADRELKDIL